MKTIAHPDIADLPRAIYPDLRDRIGFVTGGASGIGAAIVAALAAQGAKVAFVDRDAERGAALARHLADAPHAPIFRACDISDIPALQAAIGATQATLGPITALFNNAADDTRHDLDRLTPQEWDERLAINLKPAFFAAQAVRAGMQAAGGGAIVNFGSISWMTGSTGMPAYTTAKAAIHGLTRSLAREFGPDRIRVNTLVPGWTMTERQKRLWVDEAAIRRIRAGQCLPDFVMPRDIAAMALFLASEEARACSAQNFIVDGGWA